MIWFAASKIVKSTANAPSWWISLLIGTIPMLLGVVGFFTYRFLKRADDVERTSNQQAMSQSALEVKIEAMAESQRLMRAELDKKADHDDLEEWKEEMRRGLKERPLQSDLDLLKDGMEALNSAQHSMKDSFSKELQAINMLITETQNSQSQWMQKISKDLRTYSEEVHQEYKEVTDKVEELSEKVEEFNDKTIAL